GAAGTPLDGFQILSLHVTGAVFVGVGGAFNATNDDIVTTAATGFYASGVALDYVSARNLTDTFAALHLHVATVSIVGVTGLDLTVRDLDVSSNRTTGASKLDWGPQGVAVTLGHSASDISV